MSPPTLLVVVAHPDDETFGCGSLLDFADSGLEGQAAPDSLAGAPGEEITAAIRDAIARHEPDVVVTLDGSDGSDGHRDHIRVRDAVTGVLAGTETPVYLQCLPRSLMQAWARHHADDEAKAAYTSQLEIGTPDEDLTTLVDTSAFLARRRRSPCTGRSSRRSTGSPRTSSGLGSAAST